MNNNNQLDTDYCGEYREDAGRCRRKVGSEAKLLFGVILMSLWCHCDMHPSLHNPLWGFHSDASFPFRDPTGLGSRNGV